MNYPGNSIKQGDNNDFVKAIQEQLNIKGYGPLDLDGDFGAHTLADVDAFQNAHGLEADGVVGPLTWAALFHQPQLPQGLSGLALQVITGQLGQKEIPHGSNSGPMVNEYLKSVGFGPGYAWCQSLVYWSYNQAALQAGVPNPVIRTPGVMDCWNKTPAGSRIEKANATPQVIKPGYQMILDHGGGAGHTGLVESIDDNGNLVTIEGNSNTDGSRDGEMVVRQTKRTLSEGQLLGFIKY